MFNKKIYMILLLFIVSIFAISSVSAAENVTDAVAIDDAVSDDAVTSLNEDSSIEIENNDDISIENADNVETQDVLATSNDEDTLSAVSISSLNYKIDLNDNGYEISGAKGGSISYYMSPCTTYALNAYNFYFAVFQLDDNDNMNQVYKSNTLSSTSERTAKNYNFKFPAKTIAPGIYYLAAYNDGLDNNLMDSTLLSVKGTAVISADDYNSFYNSGDEIKIKVTDKDTGLPLKYAGIKSTFSNGESVSYITNSNGELSYVPPLNVGTYTVTLTSDFSFISAASVKKNVVIKKSDVTVKANKVSAYKGSQLTLKATVKSQGNNVNEGKVTFKINGKEYTVNVKNGVATKKIKLGKVKSYTYTATYKGTTNLKKSKTVSSTATVKNKMATKIIVKNVKTTRGANKAIWVTVKTTSGKVVKSGKVKIIDTVDLNKNGKAKFYASMDLNYIKQVGNTVYFKKSVTKTYTVKYIPTAAYKSSTTKLKITMKYKCTYCGSTSSHSHNGIAFIVK